MERGPATLVIGPLFWIMSILTVDNIHQKKIMKVYGCTVTSTVMKMARTERIFCAYWHQTSGCWILGVNESNSCVQKMYIHKCPNLEAFPC